MLCIMVIEYEFLNLVLAYLIRIQRLGVHIIGGVLIGQIKKDTECQIQIMRFTQVSLLS